MKKFKLLIRWFIAYFDLYPIREPQTGDYITVGDYKTLSREPDAKGMHRTKINTCRGYSGVVKNISEGLFTVEGATSVLVCPRSYFLYQLGNRTYKTRKKGSNELF